MVRAGERRVFLFRMNMSYLIFSCFRHLPPSYFSFADSNSSDLIFIYSFIPWLTCFLHRISHLITYISRCSDVVLLLRRTKPVPWVDLVDQWITSKTADGCFNDH